MNWIDKPVDRLCKSHDRLKARDRMRKRRMLERMERSDAGHSRATTLPPVTVLVDWHTDSTGCRARTVGSEG